MYALINTPELVQAGYGQTFKRGSIICIDCDHNNRMPFIVKTVPSSLFDRYDQGLIARSILYLNSINDIDLVLVKAMATTQGVAYQAMNRRCANVTRDDGEYTQRRNTMLRNVNDDTHISRHFNEATKRILSVRDYVGSREFDAISMVFNEQQQRHDELLSVLRERANNNTSSTQINEIVTELFT